jgi:hypothetical protein
MAAEKSGSCLTGRRRGEGGINVAVEKSVG